MVVVTDYRFLARDGAAAYPMRSGVGPRSGGFA
jgi:hypothetical protein